MRSENAPCRWYREPIVWLVVAIPASAVIMGAIMLGVSIATYDGLVTDDYYKKGLQINRSMERDTKAEQYGLSSLVRVGAKGGVIEVALDANRGFDVPEEVNLRLFHATRAGLDRDIVMRRVAAGRYLASRPELAAGRWYLQLDADDWRLKGELVGTDDAQRLQLGPGRTASQ
jgi:hypothetical protein